MSSSFAAARVESMPPAPVREPRVRAELCVALGGCVAKQRRASRASGLSRRVRALSQVRFEAAEVLEVLYGQDEDQRRLFRRLVAAAGRRAHAFEQLPAPVAIAKVGGRRSAVIDERVTEGDVPGVQCVEFVLDVRAAVVEPFGADHAL